MEWEERKFALIENLTQLIAKYNLSLNSDVFQDMDSEEETTRSEDKRELYLRNILITISYSLIVIVSLVGNTLVFKTIAFQPKMRNSTNILIAVLAVSDLMMTTFNIPFTVVDIINREWIFGQFFCTMVSFVQANCVYVSSFTMAVIAINRWRAVYHSRAQQPQRSDGGLSLQIILILLAIWLLAAVHSLPHTVFNQVKLKRNVWRCGPEFPKIDNWRLYLTLVTFTTQYIIPLSCAGIIYTRISFTILSQGRVGEATEDRARQMTSKKRRRIIMLILVVTIFAFCWLPFNVYYLLIDFEVTNPNFLIFMLCHWLAMSSVCYK